MTRVILFQCIIFLLWQLNILNCIRGEVLKCVIKDGGTEIHLNWRKTETFLLNEHLPIWIPKFVGGSSKRPCNQNSPKTTTFELQRNFIKSKVGDFVLYRDEEKSSAIVLFKDTGTISGFIDTRYVIIEMPPNHCNQNPYVGDGYVRRRRRDYMIHDHLKYGNAPKPNQDEVARTHLNQPSTSDDYEPMKKNRRVDDRLHDEKITTLYPETLLFVPHDVVELIGKGSPDSLSIILKHSIIFFNAVDMQLAKLSTDNIKIHLNLAGVVIENEPNVFNFMTQIDITPPPDMNTNRPTHYLDVGKSLNGISNFLNAHRDVFPEDSYDFYFIFSSDNLWHSDNEEIVSGLSKSHDMYFNRNEIQPSQRRQSGAAVHLSDTCDIHTAAHEIAHLLEIEHESRNKGYFNNRDQCYAIMQESGGFCEDCIKWTDQNRQELEKFVRTHKNRCFLLNKPRSLHPHGNPMEFISRKRQCECYHHQHWPIRTIQDHLDEVPETGCNQQLICGVLNKKKELVPFGTILPLDGTSCGPRKVCWNKECREITYVSRVGFQNN